MSKKLGLALLVIGLMLNVVGASIYAYTEVTVKNRFSTGIVDVELEEFTLKENHEVRWTNSYENILPGQKISKIPRIYNYGNDCYVRADIQFSDESFTEKTLYGISDRWFLAPDGFYYYKDVLLSGDFVDLFQGFEVPVDLSEDTALSEFSMDISVEAVQSAHFTPDFDVYAPWHDVEIQECMKEGMYDVSEFKWSGDLDFEMKYLGETGKLCVNTEDFFKNFPTLLPGDVYKDILRFDNDSNDSVNLYFRSVVPEGTELLDEVILKISKKFNEKDSVIYEGNIRLSDESGNILLATIESGESGELVYEICVPETLDNRYTIMEDSVIWIFSTEPISDPEAVATGDETRLQWIQSIFIGSMSLIIGCGILLHERMGERYSD